MSESLTFEDDMHPDPEGSNFCMADLESKAEEK